MGQQKDLTNLINCVIELRLITFESQNNNSLILKNLNVKKERERKNLRNKKYCDLRVFVFLFFFFVCLCVATITKYLFEREKTNIWKYDSSKKNGTKRNEMKFSVNLNIYREKKNWNKLEKLSFCCRRRFFFSFSYSSIYLISFTSCIMIEIIIQHPYIHIYIHL